MNQWKSVEEVLDFAIRNEEEARDFYNDLAGNVDNEAMRTVFTGFAREEEGHKAKLLKVKAGSDLAPASAAILDLKIGDYLVDVEVTPDISYQDALIVAMKKEKAAFKLYTDLSNATDDDALKSLMLALAQEEAKHKLRFEIEYDDNFMKDM